MLDVEKLIAGVHEYVERAIKPLNDRIASQDVELKALRDAAPAKDGASVSLSDVLPALSEGLDAKIAAEVEKGIAAIPRPKDGKSVTLDDLAPLQSAWALDFERYANGVLQRAIELFPKPKDGKDGFALEDLQMSFDGERTLSMKFVRGDLVKSLDMVLPTVLDRGVFREGDSYVKNDGVTFGGSYFIVKKDSPEGKPGLSDDFRLSVKRGRDGKDLTK